MASAGVNTRKAKVLWWNSSSVAVRCPFCDGFHHHGFTGYDAATGRRSSHCLVPEQSHSYQFAFPFNQTTRKAWFSIDKKRALFVAAGENPAGNYCHEAVEENSHHNAMLAENLQILETKRKWIESTETHSYEICGEHFEDERLPLVVSAMVRGDHRAVKNYLQSSSEADLFLLGIDAEYIEHPPDLPVDPDDTESASSKEPRENKIQREIYSTGKTALHLAACEQYPRMVQLLLDKGACPNARDNECRTPLAHACLWGRQENVKILLAHGADKTIPSIRDRRLLLPVDYARATEENVEERRSIAGRLYHEDTYQRDQDRREILNLLDEVDDDHLVNGERLKLWAFDFKPEPRNIGVKETMITMFAHFQVPNQWKTIGVLCRGNGFPLIAAMSGWSHSEYGNTRVHGKDWTDEVMRLSKHIGFTLEPHARDGGIHGKYNACHAEKQLIAYCIGQHRLIPQELSYVEKQQQGPEGWAEKMIRELVAVKPPCRLTKAEIMVSRPICHDCQRFVARVNEFLGFEINILEAVAT